MTESFLVEQLPTPDLPAPASPEDVKDNIWEFFYSLYYEEYSLEGYSSLLDYVTRWANEFCPSFDPEDGQEMPAKIPFIFAKQYIRGEIPDIESIKSKYENSKEILDTLEAYNIDKSKYFYLCLMLKVYINGFNDARKRQKSHIEVIKELIDKLDEMAPDDNLWHYGRVKHKAELTLKVDGIKGTFKTKDAVVLNVINACLTDVYDRYKDKVSFNFAPDNFDDKTSLSKTDKAFLFNKYLQWFWKDKKRVDRTLDRGKELLISRSYYVFEINENIEKDKYYTYDSNGNHALRDLIKKCKDPSGKVQNRYSDLLF